LFTKCACLGGCHKGNARLAQQGRNTGTKNLTSPDWDRKVLARKIAVHPTPLLQFWMWAPTVERLLKIYLVLRRSNRNSFQLFFSSCQPVLQSHGELPSRGSAPPPANVAPRQTQRVSSRPTVRQPPELRRGGIPGAALPLKLVLRRGEFGCIRARQRVADCQTWHQLGISLFKSWLQIQSVQQQAENEAAGSFFQYFQSPGTQLLHPLAGLPYFSFCAADKQLKTASQLKSFCVKTNLLFFTIRNPLNQSHTLTRLGALLEALAMLLPGSASLGSRGFSPAPRRLQSSEQPPVQTRGCPTFCKRLPLTRLRQAAWLYFSYCNTAVHNLSSAPRTLAKYSSCIIAFYCWWKNLHTNCFPFYPWESHKHCTGQRVMHLEPPLQTATAMFERELSSSKRLAAPVCQSSFCWEDTREMLVTRHCWARFWIWRTLLPWLGTHDKRQVILWWLDAFNSKISNTEYRRLVGRQNNLENQQ